jgi:hypothetical protein
MIDCSIDRVGVKFAFDVRQRRVAIFGRSCGKAAAEPGGILMTRMFLKHAPCRLVVLTLLSVAGIAPLGAQEASAQQAGQPAVVDNATMQLLLKRIDQLEARVKQLEAERQPASSPELSAARATSAPLPGMDGPPVSTSPIQESPSLQSTSKVTDSSPAAALQNAVAQTTAPPSDPEQNQSDNAMMERMDVSRTLLRIRGFGDVSLHGGTGETGVTDTTSFSLGQLDLFVTSDVSDRFKFLSEIVFEAGPDNIYGQTTGGLNSFSVDVERYLLEYSHNDYFKISAGRGHTAIGYYNTAYHHSSWLQTTTGRPLLFEFEDRGGILPIHMVGASVSGQIPSGSLGLHYIAEVGNGRASRAPLVEEPVQNEIDDENHKAVNVAMFARPEGIPGLQAGLSFYRDILAPLNQPRVGESILAGHIILERPKYEWLNEALLDRHTIQGTSLSYNTPGFYSQISKQFGAWRPYFRYQYINAPNNEPIFPDVQLRAGPSAGIRFDASESVALKFQYDYTFLRNQPGVNDLTLQLGFTF